MEHHDDDDRIERMKREWDAVIPRRDFKPHPTYDASMQEAIDALTKEMDAQIPLESYARDFVLGIRHIRSGCRHACERN